MSQDFTALKCCQCKMFQVHPAKKSNKWQCKVCGLKQSVIKVFGSGSSKDCRLYVQAANSRKAGVFDEITNNEEVACASPQENPIPFSKNGNCSKWSVFTPEQNAPNITNITHPLNEEKYKHTSTEEFSQFKRNAKRKTSAETSRECSLDVKRSRKTIHPEFDFHSTKNLELQPAAADEKSLLQLLPEPSVAKLQSHNVQMSSPSVAKLQLNMQTSPHSMSSKWSKFT